MSLMIKNKMKILLIIKDKKVKKVRITKINYK